jgi:hypothetical protein
VAGAADSAEGNGSNTIRGMKRHAEADGMAFNRQVIGQTHQFIRRGNSAARRSRGGYRMRTSRVMARSSGMSRGWAAASGAARPCNAISRSRSAARELGLLLRQPQAQVLSTWFHRANRGSLINSSNWCAAG